MLRINSTITSSNNYYTYANRGDNINSNRTIPANLKSNLFLQNYLEFTSKDNLNSNPQNVWIFDGESYQLLYIDDVVNNTSELYIGTYMWNSYSRNLHTYNFTNTITFMISDIDNVHSPC